MKQILKNVIAQTPIYPFLASWRQAKRDNNAIKTWESSGCPIPPPHQVKRQILIDYAQRYRLKILVESGTCYGDMIEAMKGRFERLYSIELSTELHARAVERFRDHSHIAILQGDSGQVIKTIFQELSAPALFWLDGHYSGGETAQGEKDTPIFEELDCILANGIGRNVILIDDARLFATPGPETYPSLTELVEHIYSRSRNLGIVMQDDIIRITPLTPPDLAPEYAAH